MAVKAPSVEDVVRMGRALGLNLSAQDAESFCRLLQPSFAALNRVDELSVGAQEASGSNPATTGSAEELYPACCWTAPSWWSLSDLRLQLDPRSQLTV